MKNFYFSIILFVLIISGALISNSYIQKTLDYYKEVFLSVVTADIISETEILSVSRAKETFSGQKNMLQLFVSKEHIKDIETNILLIENYLYEDELMDCKEKSIEIISVINQIKEYISSID